jgi:hypothetical protein
VTELVDEKIAVGSQRHLVGSNVFAIGVQYDVTQFLFFPQRDHGLVDEQRAFREPRRPSFGVVMHPGACSASSRDAAADTAAAAASFRSGVVAAAEHRVAYRRYRLLAGAVDGARVASADVDNLFAGRLTDACPSRVASRTVHFANTFRQLHATAMSTTMPRLVESWSRVNPESWIG